MKVLIINAVIFASAAFFGLNNVNAMCIIDTDWPDKPCIDTSPPLPLSKSEWQELWSDYFTFKGTEWMEKQKSELDKQVKSGKLKEWIETGYQTQNFANYNVWFYYHINDQAPAPEGYELEYAIDYSIHSPLKQSKQGVPIEQIQCKKGLALVQRSSDNSPACLKLETKVKLLQRGWAIQISKIDSQIFLEGFKDVYKVNETLEFTIVNKNIENCNPAEVEIFNKSTGEGHGIEIDSMCDSQVDGETRIDVPMGDSDMPVKIREMGTYSIILKVEGKVVFEKEFLVK